MHVVEANPSHGDFNGKGALQFIDITMAPIQTKMIKVELLTQNEVTFCFQCHYTQLHKNILKQF